MLKALQLESATAQSQRKSPAAVLAVRCVDLRLKPTHQRLVGLRRYLLQVAPWLIVQRAELLLLEGL